MTAFRTLYVYVLKHTSKKRGNTRKKGREKRPEGQKKAGLVSKDLKRHSDKIQIHRAEGALQSQCEKTTFFPLEMILPTNLQCIFSHA